MRFECARGLSCFVFCIVLFVVLVTTNFLIKLNKMKNLFLPLLWSLKNQSEISHNLGNFGKLSNPVMCAQNLAAFTAWLGRSVRTCLNMSSRVSCYLLVTPDGVCVHVHLWAHPPLQHVRKSSPPQAVTQPDALLSF